MRRDDLEPKILSEMEILTISIGDRKYTLPKSTIAAFPETMLARLLNQGTLAPVGNELAINFTPRFFEHVIDFYYTGIVYIPTEEEAPLYRMVLDYWGIPVPEEVRPSLTSGILDLSGKLELLSVKIPGLFVGSAGDVEPTGATGPTGVVGQEDRALEARNMGPVIEGPIPQSRIRVRRRPMQDPMDPDITLK